MSRIPTILVDQNTLFREGLKNLLARTSFRVLATIADSSEYDAALSSDVEPSLVIIGTKGDDSWVERNLRAMRARFAKARIVVLAEEYHPDKVHEAFRMSANGYVLKSINFTTLIKSLELVMLGEGVFPSAILKGLGEEIDSDLGVDDDIVVEEPPMMHSSRSLSAREMQILQCLVRGQSNKMIARNLDIVEATVKVHIKAILRKIRVQNRTQAAIWAVNHADGELPHIHASAAHGDAA